MTTVGLSEQVRRLRDEMFEKPAHAPGFIVVGVNSTSSPLNALTWSCLRAVSPEETRHALILAIKRDIDLKLPVDEWRRIVVSSPVQFEAVDEADASWLAGAIRQSVGALCYSSVTLPICHQLPPPSVQSGGYAIRLALTIPGAKNVPDHRVQT